MGHFTRQGRNDRNRSSVRRTAAGRSGPEAAPLMEGLEQRSMLSLSNFPLISQLQNPSDSVVRLQTNFGNIDFDLFDNAAPITVANFLKYVRDGDFDKVFFHRFAKDTTVTPAVPFVLQGGAFRLHGPTTTGSFNGSTTSDQAWEATPTDPAITNEFNQTNAERTIAMARVGGQVNSATNQFFINLKNNAFLDNTDQGFTVFGRIANDASWAVVQNIINGISQVAQGGVFNELPVKLGSGFNGTDASHQATNVTEEQLVYIRDAEVIKPFGVAAFYTYRVYYPEGFAGSTINEFLPLGNPGATAVNYQVIVRSETRDALPSPAADFWFRDKVINTSSIAANRRGGITISQFQSPSQNLVPKQGKPYAIEVWATGPIEAMLSHYDFGSSTIEAFTQNAATTWTFPDIRRGTNIRDFVVWDNTAETATVTLTFIPDHSVGGSNIVVNVTTEALRRGGISIGDTVTLADGDYSLQVTSDQPIVAALSHYKTAGADKGGATQLGITGAGADKGVLPLAGNGAGGSGVADTISVYNPNGAAAIVTLIARFDQDSGLGDFTITSAPLIIPSNSRSSFTMPDVADLQGRKFTLLYRVAANRAVFASTLHVEHGDVASNAFAYTAALHHEFGEGFMNSTRAGTDLFETVGLFNPNGQFFNASQPQPANVTLRFLFNDGFVLALDYSLVSDGAKIIDLTTLAPLLAQNANNRFYYSLDVVSDVPIVAMMSHYDTSLGGLQPSGGGSTIGTQRGGITGLQSL